jgi:3,4-dihydroxy 2-butanone 4-phosphate synthase/GTP cyclohydrolase II
VARNARPGDLVQPGHIFPLMAQKGGVLVRAGHTEAGCDLAELAGLEPAAVICEVLKDDGSMARLPDLIEFATEHGIRIGTIRDLIHYRSENETLVERVIDKEVSNIYGKFRLRAYSDKSSGEVHLALSCGDIVAAEETLVRVHEPGSILDFLDSSSLHHSFSVNQALQVIARHGRGVVVLLHRQASGQDLLDTLRGDGAGGPKAAKWDPRLYGIGAQILRDVGVGKMRLLASPRKIPSMAGFDLEVCGYLAPGDAGL